MKKFFFIFCSKKSCDVDEVGGILIKNIVQKHHLKGS